MAGLIRLKGFALLESIFAMVIIMICFGICMVIFNSIVSGSTGTRMVNARIRLQAEATRCKHAVAFTDDVITTDEFTIEKTFRPWHENLSITEMQLIARDPAGKIIAEYHELLIHPK